MSDSPTLTATSLPVQIGRHHNPGGGVASQTPEGVNREREDTVGGRGGVGRACNIKHTKAQKKRSVRDSLACLPDVKGADNKYDSYLAKTICEHTRHSNLHFKTNRQKSTRDSHPASTWQA